MFLALRPYLGLIKIGAVILVLLGAYWRGHSSGVDGERAKWEVKLSEARHLRIDEYERQLSAAELSRAESRADAKSLRALFEASEKSYAELLARIPTKPLVTHEQAPGDPCPVVRLAPDFRLRFNEAVLGTDASRQ